MLGAGLIKAWLDVARARDTRAEWGRGSEIRAVMEVKSGVQVLIGGGNLKGHKGSHLGLGVIVDVGLRVVLRPSGVRRQAWIGVSGKIVGCVRQGYSEGIVSKKMLENRLDEAGHDTLLLSVVKREGICVFVAVLMAGKGAWGTRNRVPTWIQFLLMCRVHFVLRSCQGTR